MWVDRFLPNTQLSEPELYHHRMVAAVLLSVLVYAIALLVWTPSLSLRPEGESLMLQVCSILIVGTGASLLVFRLMGNLKITVSIFMVILLLELTNITRSLGGIMSPALPIILFLPPMATVILGYRAGALWTFVLLATFFGFYSANEAGVEFSNIMIEENRALAIVLSLGAAVVLISTVVLYYEITIQKLNSRLQEEHDNYLYQANHDSLTGLANRRHFIDRIDRDIRNAAEGQRRFAILFFDLNDFKEANDNFDHHFGDEILQMTAARLRGAVRKADLVSRWGGDEFAVMLTGVEDEGMAKSRVEEMRALVRMPMNIRGIEYSMDTSVGFSLYPLHGKNHEELIHHADNGMYNEKKESKRPKYAGETKGMPVGHLTSPPASFQH